MNVVLIGARGSGKSAVARELAKLMKRESISTDAEIQRRERMSIRDLVAARGWDAFRAIETEVVRDCSARENIVIDTGGGVVVRPENIELLRGGGTLYWLRASVETLAGRIQHDTNRPALKAGKTFVEEIAEVLAEREPLYAGAAHHRIETEGREPGDIARDIYAIHSGDTAHRSAQPIIGKEE